MANILHVVNIYFVIPYFLGKQMSHFKNKGYNVSMDIKKKETRNLVIFTYTFFFRIDTSTEVLSI